MTGPFTDADIVARGTWDRGARWAILGRYADPWLFTFLRVTDSDDHIRFYGGFGGPPFPSHRVLNYYLGIEDGYRAVLARTPPETQLTLFDGNGQPAELSTTLVTIGALTLQLAAAPLPASSDAYELIATDADGHHLDAAALSI
jgi:hypothetical protein